MWCNWSVLWRKPDKILKTVLSAAFKGVKNEAFAVINVVFRIFRCILSQICHRCHILKKSCFVIFIDVWPLWYLWYSVPFLLWQCYMHYSYGTCNYIVLVYRKFNWKKHLLEGQLGFSSMFQFVNLQIRSMLKS